MKSTLHIVVGAIVALACPAAAEKNPPRNVPDERPPGGRAHVPRAVPKGEKGPRPNAQGKRSPVEGIGGAAGSPLTRWNQMSPEQREKQLSKLPPERQAQIRERLGRFNALPQEERDRLQRRYERFNSLPPARQDLVRRQIQNFSQLPQDRRPEISREFDQLRRMTPEERNNRLGSDDFRGRFNSNEREILRDLSENLALSPQK